MPSPSTNIHNDDLALPQHGLEFRNVEEALQHLATYPLPHDYQPPQDDATLCQDPASRVLYIRQLYDAFVDTDSRIDRGNAKNAVVHFQNVENGTSIYKPRDIETCCHRLLDIAIDLHTWGPRSLNVFDEGRLANVFKFRKLTFARRIDALCELLKLSKARCRSLMGFDGLEMAVATAPLMVKQAKSNAKQNEKRTEIFAAARAARNAKRAEDGDKDYVEDEEMKIEG